MSKKYTTNFLEDTNGSTGSANQVLVSTASGVDWVDGSGSGIIGGPYLPLTGGTMTGDVVLGSNSVTGTGNSSVEVTDVYSFRYKARVNNVNDSTLRIQMQGGATDYMQFFANDTEQFRISYHTGFSGFTGYNDGRIAGSLSIGGTHTATETLDVVGNATFTGIITATGGNSTEWNNAYDNHVVSLGFSGTSTTTLTLTQKDGGTFSNTFINPQGTVTGATSGNANTITVSTSSTSPVVTPVTGAVNISSAKLATGAQIQTAINTATTGVLSYQGTWNANTNSPTLTSSVGTSGYYYIVSVAGSTNLDGETDWEVGDWAVFHTTWTKIDNTQVGNVTGSGAAGRVAYWNSTSNITSDADLTFDGANLTVGGNIFANGSVYVNWDDTSSNIYMQDSDQGSRTIHCNSNYIGFLNQAGSWAFGVDDTGNTNNWYSSTIAGTLTVTGNQYFNGEFIEGDGKEMFRYSDSWLRINEDNDFTDGIYCGTGILRTDGAFQVGASGTKFLVTAAGAVTAESTLTLDNGQIVLGGTGRIQGIDTVSASTDAANKAYVDAHVTPAGTYLPLAGGQMSGSMGLADNKLYLRTNGDNNHYLWNNASDWEELVALTNTGFKITSSTGYNMATFAGTGAITFGGDLTVGGGDIILSGTGRIQGVDTVSATTDAANKAYVDAHGGGLGPFLPIANPTFTGTLTGPTATFSGKIETTQLDLVGTDTYIAYGSAGTAPSNGDYLRLRDVATGNDALQFYMDSSKLFSIDGQSGNAYHKGNIKAGSLSDDAFTRFTNPDGATYVTNASSVTGAIEIIMPVTSWTGMFSFNVEVYEYSTNKSFTLKVGGHLSGTTWYNVFSYLVSNPGANNNYNIRFGRNAAGNAIVYVGELTETWSYPQVWVTNLVWGYSSSSVAYASGWDVNFKTAFEGVTQTRTASQVGYQQTANTANSVVLRDGSGNFAAGTITAALSGNATTASSAAQVTINYNNNSNANYQLLWGSGNNVYGTGGVYVNPNSNNVYATTFTGALTGNATTATTAGTAGLLTHNANRTDSTSYPVVWMSGSSSPAYSCAAVTITSSVGQVNATTFNGALTGNASSASLLVNDGSGMTTQRGSGTVAYPYAINSTTTGLFAANSNANSILTVNKHPGNYYSQLGFSSNGNLYYRSFANVAINATQAWNQIAFTSSLSGYLPVANPTFTGTLTGPAATITTVTGALVGNVTGNVSGSSGSTTGNAATVTNGVYTTGTQTITGLKVFDDFHLQFPSKTTANFGDLNNSTSEIRMFDVYNLPVASTGMLSTYGTLFQINGRASHDKTQFAFNGSNGSIQYRKSWYPNTAWTSFRKIWDSNNDGSGSGLDADLLDGQQGSYYVNTSTTQSIGGAKTFTTTPISVTRSTADNSTYLATTAFVKNQGYVSSSGVTSVGGTGTVSGINLSGTVTSTGNLTLGGTLSASITNISDATRWWNNFGQNHSARTQFDASSPSYGFGWRYVQGTTNGPATGGNQYYSAYVGLGNEYPSTGSGSYGMYIAIDRNVTSPYLSVRFNESNSLGSWRRISAGKADVLTTARTIAGVSFNGSANISLNNNAITNGAGYITSASLPSVGNGTLTVQGTGVLGGSGTFTANQSGNSTISVTHDNSGVTAGTYTVATVTVDATGHVTSASTNTVSEGESMSTIAKRTINGYLHASYFNGSGTFATSANTSGMGRFTGTNGTDTYGRSYTAAAARTLLNVANGATNVTNNNQLTNGAGYTTNTGSVQGVGVASRVALWKTTDSIESDAQLFYNSTTNTLDIPNLYIDGGIVLDDVDITGVAQISTGDILLGNYLYHAGDTNTYLGFATDTISLNTNGSTRLAINNLGRVGIGTTAPETTLHVDGVAMVKDSTGVGDIYLGNYAVNNHFRFHTNNANTYFDMNCGNIYWRQGSSNRYYFYPSTANMTVNGTITQNSDSRVKENVVEIGNCISKVQAMRGVYYNRTDFNTEVTKVGVIAQEVEAVLPELILEAPDTGLKSVAYAELTAVLINAIKEQQEIIENLTTRIEQLEN